MKSPHHAQEMVILVAKFMTIVSLYMATNAAGSTPGSQLDAAYYDNLCSDGTDFLETTTATVVKQYVTADSGLPPAMIRMAFHDCMVRGCDSSILINSTSSNLAEKDGAPNINSLRGYEVIDAIKTKLEATCPGVYSCADIVQQAALAAIKLVQNNSLLYWNLLYGRRDGRISLATETLTNLPAPTSAYADLVSLFSSKGLSNKDLVVLSGAHTFGVAHCTVILTRLYNFSGKGDTDPALDSAFAKLLKQKCPSNSSSTLKISMSRLESVSNTTFDDLYFKNVLNNKGFFTSDSQLKNDTTDLEYNSAYDSLFFFDFQTSMKKLSEVNVTLYPKGEVRTNCAVILS